jgi:hypothetical protein
VETDGGFSAEPLQRIIHINGVDLGGGPLLTGTRGFIVCGCFHFAEGPVREPGKCYHFRVFSLSRPKTPGQWIAHIGAGIIALFLVWWQLRVYVLCPLHILLRDQSHPIQVSNS